MRLRVIGFLGSCAMCSAVLALSAALAAAQQAKPLQRVPAATSGVQPIDALLPSGHDDGARLVGSEDQPGVPTRAAARPAGEPALMPIEPPKADADTQTPQAPPSDSSTPAATEESSSPPAASAADQPSDATPAGNDKSQEALTPVPEAKSTGPAQIEPESVKGVTPGVSTKAEVEKAWGAPKEVQKGQDVTVHLYSLDSFPRVEVSFRGDKVSAIIVRFEQAASPSTLAQHLDLVKIQPVLVSSELGEILGQAYPERGVLFSFEPAEAPGKMPTKVSHIIVEPVSAEPFALRAETNLDSRPEFALHDLDQALKLQPGNARAHWLRSRVLTALGEYEKAAAAAGEAVRLAPGDARYYATQAQALSHIAKVAEAMSAAQKAVELSEKRPHVKARALCLLGDLAGSGPRGNFKQAMQFHAQAIQAAAALTGSKHPAIRTAAKEVLIDAHLGAAHDIAWGNWREKEKAVESWLGKASGFADDLIKNDGGSDECRFRVSSRALAACVGVRGSLDPSTWAREAVRSGESLIAATPDAARKAQLQWEVGMALYDALQAFQMRSDQKGAMRCGEMAVSYMEKSGKQASTPGSHFLMGRLYFRLGAIHAIGASDHRAAVTWFDKAVGLLGKSLPREVLGDLGRHGETFVSMGVSYWEAGQREKAVSLTEHGLNFMEEAVREGSLDKAALAVPYSNLASMHRQLGRAEKASHFDGLAAKHKAAQTR